MNIDLGLTLCNSIEPGIEDCIAINKASYKSNLFQARIESLTRIRARLHHHCLWR